MSIAAKPPPLTVPTEEERFDEFFRDLLSSLYQIWQRTGTQLAVTGNVGLYGVDPVDQAVAMTASDTNSPNSGDATTDAIIANLQARVDELEAGLDSSTGIGVFE